MGGKIGHLEGLRGIAAMAVMFGHLLNAFWPAATSATGAVHHSLETWLFNAPGFFHAPYDGAFAVLIFFVLSGYVLTYRADQPGVLEGSAMRRYLRLALPALGSVLVAYVLLASGLMHNQAAADITRSEWLAYFYRFPADLYSAFMQGSFGSVLFGQVSYNTSLWTIRIEFFGALLVLALALVFRPAGAFRAPAYVVASVLCILLFGTHGIFYASIVWGLVLAELVRGDIQWSRAAIAALVLTAFYLGGANDGASYVWLTPLDMKVNEQGIGAVTLAKAIAAVLLVLAVLRSGDLQRLLSTKLCANLGRLSFSIYLLHLMVICSAGSFTFLKLHAAGLHHYFAAAIASGVSVAIAVFGALLFERFVDRPSIAAAKSFSAAILRPPNGAPGGCTSSSSSGLPATPAS